MTAPFDAVLKHNSRKMVCNLLQSSLQFIAYYRINKLIQEQDLAYQSYAVRCKLCR